MDAVQQQRFDPVWLSTGEQLDALSSAYRSAPLWRKLLGRLRFGPDVTHVRGTVLPWARMPIAYVAAGALEIGPGVVRFRPRVFPVFGWRIHGLHPIAAWEISASEVKAVEPADFPSPVTRYFDIPFTRLRTTRPAPLDTLLVCAGGRLSVARIRSGSLDLRKALQGLIA